MHEVPSIATIAYKSNSLRDGPRHTGRQVWIAVVPEYVRAVAKVPAMSYFRREASSPTTVIQ